MLVLTSVRVAFTIGGILRLTGSPEELMGQGVGGGRGRETTGVVHSLHLVDVHNIYTDIRW